MNPLVNVLTPRTRAILYAALFVGALLFAAWQAAEGDWITFIGSVITSLLGLTAASNASWTPEHGVTDEPVTPEQEFADEGFDFSDGDPEAEPVEDVQGRHEAPYRDDYGYRG